MSQDPMTDVEQPKSLDDFLATGRTGRRNALPDILDKKHANTGTGDLSGALNNLQCSEGDDAGKTSSSEESKENQTEDKKGS